MVGRDKMLRNIFSFACVQSFYMPFVLNLIDLIL